MELPAGIIDQNIEIIDIKGEPFAFYKGETIPFAKVPQEIYNAFFEEMMRNEEVTEALSSFTTLTVKERFYTYLICRYGGVDSTPDLNISEKKFTPDFHNCGNRENCPFNHILCDKIPIKTENDSVYLTRKEIEIVKLIASGLPDKQSAIEAHIMLDTFLTHKKNIYSKLNINSNTQLTAIAFRNNLNE